MIGLRLLETGRSSAPALLAIALGLSSGIASAQDAKKEAPGPWRAQTALDLPEGVRISGSVRARYEALANPFVAGRTDDDELLGLQTILRAEFDIGKTGFTLGGDLLDSRFITGNETGGAATELDALEPAQLYLAWRPRDIFMKDAKLDVTAGRFTMDIGSRRLVARANFRSILQSFDGVRAVWTSPDKLAVTLAYTAPVTREPADAASSLDNEVVLNRTQDNIRFSLAHIDAPLPQDLRGELYVMKLDEDDASDNATRNRDLATIGARLRKLPAKAQLDFDAEYASQTGHQRATTSPADITPLDHDAALAHLEAGYSFDAPWSPRLSLHWDYGTGESNPADADSERFDTLFGDRSFEIGPTGTFGFIARNNVSSPGIRLEVKPDGDSEVYVMARKVDLESARDSFANANVRDITGASGKDVGAQLEARYRRWLVKDSLRLTLGAAAIFEGDFLKTAPNATGLGDPLYTYADITWTF